jgi:hypothetical protein
MKRLMISLGLLAPALILAISAAGAAPNLVNYQGVLTDADGFPISGTVDLEFAIYADSSQASPDLWNEEHADVAIENGLFNVILGSDTSFPQDLFDGNERWLGVIVDGEPEILPRMRFTSVPWALHSAVADTALSGAGGADSDWIIADNDMYSGVSGNIGIGTTSPARQLEIRGDTRAYVRLTSTATYNPSTLELKGVVTGGTHDMLGAINFLDQNDGLRSAIGYYEYSGPYPYFYLRFATADGLMVLTDDGNVGIGMADPREKLDVYGTIQGHILKLTGGADLAEPFDIRDPTSVEPGMVLTIDPANSGELKLSDRPYDRCVAGIVSGAGGIRSGLLMGQKESPADGECPVALSGRVYCWATAANGPIVPGDLLTTADLPGHAMKVTDHARAVGAMIGKAMTSLPEGRGLVLVLVSLQ